MCTCSVGRFQTKREQQKQLLDKKKTSSKQFFCFPRTLLIGYLMNSNWQLIEWIPQS